ncbi:MAG: hypothetical protein M3O35_18340 [Acidobacteriota bacterium]|nr:hypothetical protein [Acidobacteriota bacterium]
MPRLAPAAGFLVFTLLISSCGYIGEPLYPALNIPTRVTDLAAIERGNHIDVSFTIPPLTTEGLALKQIREIELRAGPNTGDFEVNRWAESAKKIDVPTPMQPGPVQAAFPVESFAGKEIIVAARVVNSKGRVSAWSNIVIVSVGTPLATPSDFAAKASPEGVRLTWNAPGQAAFRIYRVAPGETHSALLGSPTEPQYLDAATEYGKTYTYYVQSVHDKAESDGAGPVTITPKDEFPPAAPAGLAAAAGADTIELSWERNTESDFKEYRVYRSLEGGPFERIAAALEAPGYSDRKLPAGKHYRYRVTAVDQSGNESDPSPIVEAIAP